MALAFKGTTATVGSVSGNGSMTPALPTGFTVDHLSILAAYLDSGTASGPENAGWTVATGSPYGANTPKLYVWYRRLLTADTAPTITISSAGTATSQAEAAHITYTSDADVTPIEAFSSGTQGTGTPVKAAAVTTVSASAIGLAIIGVGGTATFGSEAIGGSTTGVTERADKQVTNGDDSSMVWFDKTIATAGSSGTATAVLTGTTGSPFVGVMLALSPKVEVPVVGVRAAATGTGRAGAPSVTVTGVRAVAAAAGGAGTPTVIYHAAVTGARATAVAKVTTVYAIRLTATNDGGSDPETKTAYVYANRGTPKVAVAGARAVALAVGRGGTIQIDQAQDATVTGVRALATATSRPGSPQAAVTGARAGVQAAATHLYAIRLTATNASGADSETKTAYVSATGTPKVSITARATAAATGTAGATRIATTGTRAAAAATGTAGSPKVTVTGARATATATGTPGTPTTATGVTVVGVRALATAVGRGGTIVVTETLTGARAAATAAGRPGSPSVTVTGVRAIAAAAGRAGVVAIDAPIAGARAAATAAGTPGSPRVAIQARTTALATGTAGSPRVAVTGQRAVVVATGTPGDITVGNNIAIVGVRAIATAIGQGGILAYTSTVTGARAVATASAHPAGPTVSIAGARAELVATGTAGGFRHELAGVTATVTASGREGTPAYDSRVIGTRAVAIAIGRAGVGTQAASPAETWQTRIATQDSITTTTTNNRRTRLVATGRVLTMTSTKPRRTRATVKKVG